MQMCKECEKKAQIELRRVVGAEQSAVLRGGAAGRGQKVTPTPTLTCKEEK
jgi:hypothetical protein